MARRRSTGSAAFPATRPARTARYYIANKVTIVVPIWDVAGGQGANAWYHIIGFAGMQLTACDGGKDIEGVLRQLITPGPVTTTPGPTGSSLGVQLVR